MGNRQAARTATAVVVEVMSKMDVGATITHGVLDAATGIDTLQNRYIVANAIEILRARGFLFLTLRRHGFKRVTSDNQLYRHQEAVKANKRARFRALKTTQPEPMPGHDWLTLLQVAERLNISYGEARSTAAMEAWRRASGGGRLVVVAVPIDYRVYRAPPTPRPAMPTIPPRPAPPPPPPELRPPPAPPGLIHRALSWLGLGR